jgi:hypothetical protein
MAEAIKGREITSGERVPVVISFKLFTPFPSGRRGKILSLVIRDYGLSHEEATVKYLYGDPVAWCREVYKELNELIPEFQFTLEATLLVVGKKIFPVQKKETT